MSLPNNLSSLTELIAKLPQEKIARAIIFVLLGYIAYLASQLTWMFIPQAETNYAAQVQSKVKSTQSGDKQVNLSGIKALNLFGVFDTNKAVDKKIEIQDAPETRLKLTLSGVVASDEPSIAAAIIENNGTQETYGIGDTIKGTRAVLESVFNDRVLIKQSGRLETLMLDGFKYQKASKAQSPKSAAKSKSREQKRTKRNTSPNKVIDQRRNKELTNSVTNLKRDINKSPGKITDYLKISPKRQNGAIVGYRLMPGKKSEFFKASGLKSGDVATQMNGFDLTVPSEAAQALKALRQEREVSLLLDRNGEMTEILFSINE